MKSSSDNLISILSDLIAFDSSGYNYVEKKGCLDYVEDYLNKYSLHTTRHESNSFPSLVASTQGGKNIKILLQAHMDVVPAKPGLFMLKEQDGKLIGRGTYDMKFAAACYLQIINDLRNELTDYNFGLMLTTDEELGGIDGVGYLVKEGYRTNVCVIPDGGNNMQIESKCNDIWFCEIIAEGESAHGSRPWEGENAIYKLMEGLIDIQRLFGEQKPFSNSITISRIDGGIAENQVPDHATATLDMRFTDNDQYKIYKKAIELIVNTRNLNIKTSNLFDGSRVDLSHPEVVRFLKVTEELTGTPIKKTHSLGSSDAHYFAKINVPTIVIRPKGGGAHSENEWIDKDGLLKFYEILKAYVLNSAKLTNND